MKIYAENGVYLGIVEYENFRYTFKPKFDMSEYMLEETLKIVKKLNRLNKVSWYEKIIRWFM